MSFKVIDVKRRNATETKRKYLRIYVWLRQETIGENLHNRFNRPEREWRKLLPQVFEQARIPAVFLDRVKWSQKAGCACGCSPGFVVNGYESQDTVHVNVKPV